MLLHNLLRYSVAVVYAHLGLGQQNPALIYAHLGLKLLRLALLHANLALGPSAQPRIRPILA